VGQPDSHLCGIDRWGLYVATSLLGSYLLPFISTDALDPAAQGLIIGMCGFCYGPIFGLFIGLVEIVFLRIYLRSNLKEPDWKLRRVIFGVSALVGIGVPLIMVRHFLGNGSDLLAYSSNLYHLVGQSGAVSTRK
jgi:hypothetical protein